MWARRDESYRPQHSLEPLTVLEMTFCFHKEVLARVFQGRCASERRARWTLSPTVELVRPSSAD